MRSPAREGQDRVNRRGTTLAAAHTTDRFISDAEYYVYGALPSAVPPSTGVSNQAFSTTSTTTTSNIEIPSLPTHPSQLIPPPQHSERTSSLSPHKIPRSDSNRKAKQDTRPHPSLERHTSLTRTSSGSALRPFNNPRNGSPLQTPSTNRPTHLSLDPPPLLSKKSQATMCNFETLHYRCGHSDRRRYAYCHAARNDPAHACLGVKVMKRTYSILDADCEQCTTMGLEEQARRMGLRQ